MAGDKRTVLSTRRARDRRQRAQRRASNKRQLGDADAKLNAGSALASPTGADDALDADEYADAIDAMDVADNDHDADDGADDDELVIVCHVPLPNFCTRFVPAEQLANARGAFTASIPSFRETSDGFIVYRIVLAAADGARFELERRFSEFVALASALRYGNDCDAPSGASQRGRESERSEADEESDDASDRLAALTEAPDAFSWQLPPKTWFKVTQRPALEERRRQLEQSLAHLLEQPAMSRRALVRDFLMLDIFGAQVAEEKHRCVGE